ncbi:MAG: hypothetical protein ACRDDA_03150 [Aeromonas sp.]
MVYYFQIGNRGVDIGIKFGRDGKLGAAEKTEKSQNEHCVEGAGGVIGLKAEPQCVDAFGEYVHRNGLAGIWVGGAVFLDAFD